MYYHVRTAPDDDRVVLVEGIIDALAVGQYTNSIATLSWRLHVAQLDDIARRYAQVIYMPDGDVPADRLMEEMRKLPVGSITVELPKGDDPASMGPIIKEWICNT